MTVGLRVRDAATGVTTLTLTDRITRVIGRTTISGAGFLSVPEFSNGSGTGWFQILDSAYGNQGFTSAPQVVVEAGGLRWSQGANGSGYTARAVTMIYGVY